MAHHRLPPHLPVVAATLLALAVRLYHLDFQSLWRDEVDVARFSAQSPGLLFEGFLKPGENGPLYYLFHHFWLGAFGDSEMALRLPSALFGVVVVPVLYGLARLLLDPTAARLSALIAALSPYYVWYSQDAKMYALLALLTNLSLYLYLLALRTDRAAAWIGYFAVTTISLYIHFFAALVVLAELVVFLLFFRDLRRPLWYASISLLILPYLPLAMWQIPTFVSPPATGYPSFSPQGIAAILLVLFVRGFGPGTPLFPLTLALFLLMAAAALYWRSNGTVAASSVEDDSFSNKLRISSAKGIWILLVFLVVPLAAFVLISLRMPLFADRYLIVVTPGFYLLVAGGFSALWRYHRAAFWIAILAWFAIALHSLVWQSHARLKSDFRAAAASFATAAEPNDLVIFNMPYARYAFQYYYRRPIQWLDAPYTNDGLTIDQIDPLLRVQLPDRKALWLVSSEEHLWDTRGLLKQWLQANLASPEVWTYPGVQVVRYPLTVEGE